MTPAPGTRERPAVSVEVRTRRTGDLPACVSLLRQVHIADGYPGTWPRDPARWLAVDTEFAAWVAERDGRILGHISLYGIDEQRAWPAWRTSLKAGGGPLAVLSRFFVDPHERGGGVGGALLDAAHQHAAAHRLTLVLEVAVHLTAAIGVYEQRDWRCVGDAIRPASNDRRALPVLLFVAPQRVSGS